MRKPTFCICENKDADQLRGHRKADQRLCFPYIDSTIPLFSKSEISSLLPSSKVVQPGFVSDQVGNQNIGFLMTRLISFHRLYVMHQSFVTTAPPQTGMGGDNDFSEPSPGISPALLGKAHGNSEPCS